MEDKNELSTLLFHNICDNIIPVIKFYLKYNDI